MREPQKRDCHGPYQGLAMARKERPYNHRGHGLVVTRELTTSHFVNT